MASSAPSPSTSASDFEEDEDQVLANFLESEILSVGPEQLQCSQQKQQQEEELVLHDDEKKQQLGPLKKRPRLDSDEAVATAASASHQGCHMKESSLPNPPRLIVTGSFSKMPPELFRHILNFLSSEDLIACSLVCRFMNFAASDESLWRRLYCMRWGLASPSGKLHTCPWKRLYIQRDQEDMVEFIRNTPSEFKEYYIQMQAAKRSQAPNPSQVNDDSIILDRTVADKVSIWKSKRGLTDEVVLGHACSGNTCTYSQIGDVFLCEKTGRVHVCDDTCREVVLDPSSGILVCTISGHCFDRLLSPEEEMDVEQQGGATDEAEPFMGSGRFARAYLLGYNCADEKELKATLRFC